MYLWKYWRESRTVLILAAVLLSLFVFLAVKAEIKMDSAPAMSFNAENFPPFGRSLVGAFYAQATVLSFLAWLMGGVGLGRNLGEDSGSYLLTRPRRRAWFLWRDWACGMVELAAIAALTNLLIWQFAHHLLMKFHDPLHGRIPFQGACNYPLSLLMGLIFLGVLLFCGLVFSITYFSTIVMKHARGTILGAGLLAGYVALGKLVQHYWPSIEWPTILVRLFEFSHRGVEGFSHSLILSMTARVVVMLLFLTAAQRTLERSDI